jgi:hypothetical protein
MMVKGGKGAQEKAVPVCEFVFGPDLISSNRPDL